MSGSTDHRARLWRLSDRAPVKTLDTQSHWTVTVLLRSHRREEEGDEHCSSSNNTLLTMSKKEIHVFRWSSEEELRKLSAPCAVIPLKPEGSYQELRDAFFTPGLSLSANGEQITFVRQMPLFETQTIGM